MPAFITSDSPEAAFLTASGFKLIEIRPDASNPRRAAFTFDETAELLASVATFRTGATSVEPRRFTAVLKALSAQARAVVAAGGGL